MRWGTKTGQDLFAAWHSDWNANTYLRTKPFRDQPCLMDAGSTAGAPVALGTGFLAGLLKECDAVFEWDGRHLTVDAPENALFVSTAEEEAQRWAEYHQALGIQFRRAPFGLMPEYCTWVEQMRRAVDRGFDAVTSALTLELIRDYLNTIKKNEWPTGRFTVDAGWTSFSGPGGFGDWDPVLGMDMTEIAQQIASHGHVPGLWLAPALIDRNSRAARQNMDLVGLPVEMDGECEWTKYNYLYPSEASQKLIIDLFRKAYDWGFRKFKLDILYGPKPVMYELSRQCRVAVELLPEPVELEGHIPDPFCARHMDVIRLNDVLISERHPDWRSVCQGHLDVCRRSAPGMVLNLDHVGGNFPDVGELLFVEHVGMLKKQLPFGYPAVSLLPQHLGEQAVDAVSELLAQCRRDEKTPRMKEST